MRTCALFFKGGNIIIGKVNDAAQAINGLLHAVDFFRHDFQLVDGAVKRQRRPVAIVNNAAAWCDRHQLDAVFVRTRLVVGKTNDLQIVEVGNQHAGKQQNSQKSDHRPAHKKRGLCRIVAKRIL